MGIDFVKFYAGARLHRVPTYFFRLNKAFATRLE